MTCSREEPQWVSSGRRVHAAGTPGGVGQDGSIAFGEVGTLSPGKQWDYFSTARS